MDEHACNMRKEVTNDLDPHLRNPCIRMDLFEHFKDSRMRLDRTFAHVKILGVNKDTHQKKIACLPKDRSDDLVGPVFTS